VLPLRFRALLLRLDPALYVLWSAACTLASARLFYGYMLKQTGGEWSAPLDDVFIHFDYARSTALGHPFEWVVGNGYSSGNTSLSYPFVLAFGWLVGFREMSLMFWAAIVAATCVFGLLLAARPLFFTARPRRQGQADGWGRAFSYLLPPVLLGVGALDWSLWSGMEVAAFLGTWACALYTFLALDGAPPASRERARLAWALGACGAIMTVTRPEATTTIAVFGVASLFPPGSRGPMPPMREGIAQLLRIGSPSVLILTAQTIANRAFTGEWSANGAIVKLATNSPYLTPDEKLADYTFNLKYAVLRNVEYHFADAPAFGVIIPALAFAALAVPATRRIALILWGQIAGWLLLVALNGQVRWQNERYTMPAVAWLLIAAALGATAMLRRRGRPNVVLVTALGALAAQAIGVALRPPNTAPELRVPWLLAIGGGAIAAALFRLWPARIAGVAAALVVAHVHQAPKMRDQKWFFGRASRNIRDQHITAGRWLAQQKPHRVLVGDAGALLYASDRLGLDIIGLGGLDKYPFARAGVHGLPATLELMEYLPVAERPDVMAIYPTWWGVLPTWFSSGVLKRFPVEGNVICGGYEKVIYKADWHLLGSGNETRRLPLHTVVKDEVDIADLVSEGHHEYKFPSPGGGWTEMKILADLANPRADVWDGGRRTAAARGESFPLRGLESSRAAHLVVRTAPESKTTIRVVVDGNEVARTTFEPTEGWVERAIPIPGPNVSNTTRVAIENDGPGDFIDYHLWIAQ
jgi:hypothetical protein